MNGNAVSLISRIREGANRLIQDELKKAGLGELSPSHGDILALLLNFSELTATGIAKKIHRTKATTTVLIDKLEKSGFLKREKSASDNRYTNIVLTTKGQALKPVFEKISKKLNVAVYKGLTESEAIALETLLEKLRINLSQF